MATLDQILEAIFNKQANIPVSTLIVHNHLAQMRLFGVRQGIEIYPGQDDDFDSRKDFISNIWKQNQLDVYLDEIWNRHLGKGQLLFYLRPTKTGSYKIYFYDKDNFRDYYDLNGDLNEVVIRYSYKERSEFNSKIKWIKLIITSSEIKHTVSDQAPSFDSQMGGSSFETNYKVTKNTLGFIPCVITKNNPSAPGEPGVGDFDALKSQIEKNDNQAASIDANLDFFGNPSLVTTRSAKEVTEAINGTGSGRKNSRTMSSSAGFYSSDSPSTRNQSPYNSAGMDTDSRVMKLIGGVQSDERFGYISPDPVSPDHMRHLQDTREAIHFALGGIDERGINANATAYANKAIYGRVAATAKKKCKALYDYGLCKLFEMAIAAEEDLFRLSLAAALNKFNKETGEPDISTITDEFIGDLISKGKVPQNVFGLSPIGVVKGQLKAIGSREMKWRHTGEVFEPSPDDIQRSTIAARNYQELGMGSVEALRTVFPNKTDKELEGMLGEGFPFRYMGAVVGTIQQMLGLYGQMLQLPDETGNAPLAQSIPLAPLIGRSIETLYKELNYDPKLTPVQPGDIPNYSTGYSNYDQSISNPGVNSNSTRLSAPTSPSTSSTVSPTIPNYPSPLAAIGISAPNINPQPGGTQLLGEQIQSTNVVPEYAVGIPAAGAVVSEPQPAGYSQPQQSLLSTQPGITAIPPDLAVGAEQPGSIWSQLFPTFSKPFRKRKAR